MSGPGEDKVVCVTGASGYIASWLVKQLLGRGYTVKASVRDANDPRKTEHLTSLDGAKERLKLFQANLLDDGSFDEIVQGCTGVFHTASPVNFSVSDPKKELLDPAVKGTLNLLQSCAKVSSIRRVILTSSIAAVLAKPELNKDSFVDESWFSNPSYCEEQKMWYQLSKTLAEDAAWKFSKEHGIDMVSINPGWVFGPILQPSINLSAGFVLDVVNGAQSFPDACVGWIDVRDVACAHIHAFEIPSANGRYCVVGKNVHWSEIVKILRQLFPTLQLPNKGSPNSTFGMGEFEVSMEKTKGLGINFIPLEVSLKDTVESFKEKNFITF
ncbi:unnamed protein product [Coffea canephora]|uniref:Dihydroflavonol 4-reductase n=1 Tax=Coffea canephora TaxID=49390 RepID=A0A068VDH1_COFCA|nr:unnamed protein product [Coffea canephora]